METVGAERDGLTRKQAEAELRERPSRSRRSGGESPPPATFKTAIAEWFDAMQVEKGWKPSTAGVYRGVIERLNDTFGPMQLAHIEPGDIVTYKTKKLKTYGASIVSRDLSLLHSFFEWAAIAKGIHPNPTDGVPHPQKPRWKGSAFAGGRPQAILRGFDDMQARVVFVTVVLTGIRCAEMQSLKVDPRRRPDRQPPPCRRFEDENRGAVDRAPDHARRGALAVAPHQQLPERPPPRLLLPGQRRCLPVGLVQTGASAGLCGLRGGTPAGVPETARPPRDQHHQRGACERARREAAGAGRARELLDDATVHRPRRRRLPRRSGVAEERMLGLSTGLSTDWQT